MSKSNETKSKALGMSHGTAANRLRKNILFSFVCRLDLNMCHQCRTEILSVEELSIEHKEPWLRADDPVKSFFDLDNIAFSHLSCNSGAAFPANKKYTNEKARLRAKHKRRWARIGGPEERKAHRRRIYEKYGC